MPRHFLGDDPPAAVVCVTAEAIAALTIPIIAAPLLGDLGTFRLIVLENTLNIVTPRLRMQSADKIDDGHSQCLPDGRANSRGASNGNMAPSDEACMVGIKTQNLVDGQVLGLRHAVVGTRLRRIEGK